MKKIILLLLLLSSKAAFSQVDQSIVKFKNPSSVNAPNGYSHVVQVDLGNSTMLIISGQIALDNKGNLVGKNDMAKQTEQAFLNIKSIVEDAGGNMNNVVKLGYFVTDISQIKAVRQVRDKFVNVQTPPASTTVQVSKLVRDDLMIELEATAIIPNKK
ncbi:MAG: RidA family protein [Mucilaginibacter sp.]|uniref:RidA family protein n=1 Tax=Mucilaginibacter sp. TaxID=1882438 RepID=UPI0031A7D8FD